MASPCKGGGREGGSVADHRPVGTGVEHRTVISCRDNVPNKWKCSRDLYFKNFAQFVKYKILKYIIIRQIWPFVKLKFLK